MDKDLIGTSKDSWININTSSNYEKFIELIDIINHFDNREGDNIKIIIGSSVTSEGIDFRNIREIHIMEPWFHLYKIEQLEQKIHLLLQKRYI